MSQMVEVRVPDLGSFKDVTVIDLLVAVGDRIDIETPLATLETEKATMDVPSPIAGVVQSMSLVKGATVNSGDLLAVVQVAEGAALALAAPAAAAVPVAAPEVSAPVTRAAASAAAVGAVAATTSVEPVHALGLRADLPFIDEPGFSRAYAGPSVRKLARELGVDLVQVAGSGPKGRITHDDVKSWVKKILSGGGATLPGGAALPKVPVVDFAAFGPVEVRPLTRVQKISGPRLHAAWVNLPHVTQFDEADITDLEDARTKLKQRAVQQGIKLTPLAFLVRACVRALAEFPKFNSSLDEAGQNLVYKKYVHIGFAADTPNGLLVPVIRDADQRDVYEIARLLGELSEKARTGKLSGADMQGGCFTISSLGGIGGTAFTPIINAPEVAILGVSRSAMKPIYRDGSFVPRLMLPLSLSYDHRVIDGAEAARFTTYLAQSLADPRALLEALP
jgi:pyruvate dehydrogenase E2 component (dihydrolipoamide acetyltransferase)